MSEFRILPSKKIFIDLSPIHGLGVFASEKIYKDEIIEESPILTLPINKGEISGLLLDYRFNWPQGSNPDEQVVGLGFASLYNHSESPNAYWISDLNKRTFKFVASRDIEPEEEIFVWYGDMSYWNDGRNHVKIKD